MSKAVYKTGSWKRLRLIILERDKYTCQECGKPANSVDHIIEISAGGKAYDPLNCEALCTPCNTAKANKRRAIKPSRNWYG